MATPNNYENALKVKFADPCAGWLGLEISTPREQFNAAVSFTPNDFVLELTTALSLSLQGMDGTAIASCEPNTYEFTFVPSRLADAVRLKIMEYRDWKRRPSEGIAVLSVQASRREVILPFWRALRALEGRITRECYLEAFRRDFPGDCLQRVSQMIDALRDE
jgi:hypothetical protein